jgi:uncharacterized repeat protein (TIGR01451 family)
VVRLSSLSFVLLFNYMEVAEMTSVTTRLRLTLRVVSTLAAMSAASNALAVGTPSGTSVSNLATVDYDVGGVAQLAIESSPTGNSSPGAGAGQPTAFVVDNMVDLTVAEVGGAATPVNPGQGNAVTTFTVTNTGNTAQDYALVAANLTSADPAVHGNVDTDDDGNNLRVFVDGNSNGTFEPANDTATFIGSLAADASVTVFVLVDVPIGTVDSDVINVSLTAVTHDAGSGAASLTAETSGPDTAAVDIVFGDAGNDGEEADNDGYVVSGADLTISKTATILNDPFNGTTNPKAIPGAVIEYTITVNNTGSTVADNVRITDIISADLTLLLGQYNGGASDVRIESGAGPSLAYCTADASDGDGDGCGLVGGTLDVDPVAGITVGTTGADNPVRIVFQATVN